MLGNKWTEREKAGMHAAAQRVVEVHHRLAAFLRPGQTLIEVDRWVAKTLEELNCRSCFLNYKVDRHPPFPSHACLSVNDCVVHGTALAHKAPIKNGDLVKIDIGVLYDGWIGDAGWTYVFGEPSPLVAKLTACGKEALRRGVATLRPENRLRAFAEAVQGHVEKECGFFCIRNLGGHGYGRKLHGKPFVSNTIPGPGDAPWAEINQHCAPGMLVAVEPMVGAGTGDTMSKPNPFNPKLSDWPVYTADGSLSVHYEHDVLVTEDGPRVLTHGLEDVRDVIA